MLHDLDLYREFYKADRHRFRDVQWELVLSDDPVIIKRLEAFSKTTQKRAVPRCSSPEIASNVMSATRSGTSHSVAISIIQSA